MFQYHILLAVASYISLFWSIHCVPKKLCQNSDQKLRNCAVDFVEICNVYLGKMIIKATKGIFNFDKICRSYSDVNFGVIFLEHSVLDLKSTVSLHCSNAIWFYCIKFLSLQCEPLEPITVHAEHLKRHH